MPMIFLGKVLGGVMVIECPQCGGEGRCEYERGVVDWKHGGYLEAFMDECDECQGSGEVEIEVEEEDDEDEEELFVVVNLNNTGSIH